MAQLSDFPLWLCHYTRASTAFEKILPSRRLRMNAYAYMRDPFENRHLSFASAGGWGEQGGNDRLYWGLQQAIAQVRDSYCLLSFTRHHDGADRRGLSRLHLAPWARPRMWEQYADVHAGVCLIFERNELLQAVQQDLGAHGQYHHGEVHYTVGGFSESKAAQITLNDFNEATIADDIGRHVHAHFDDFFLLKTDDWASEWEYPIVFKPAELRAADEPLSRLVSYGDSLRYVVVGERFPEWQLPGAQAVAAQAGVELRRMTWNIGQPWPGQLNAGDVQPASPE